VLRGESEKKAKKTVAEDDDESGETVPPRISVQACLSFCAVSKMVRFSSACSAKIKKESKILGLVLVVLTKF
jgi:hypothetical protein